MELSGREIDELVERYYGAILHYCRWQCKDAQLAQDLTQETFYRALRALGGRTLRRDTLQAYLYATARHLWIDEVRRGRACVLQEEAEAAGDRDLARVEADDAFLRLVARLPQPQKEALVLRFGHGLSLREVAAVQQCGLRTAQSRVRRGLEQLRREVEP